MKTVMILGVLIAAGWMYYAWSHRPAPAPNAAERYAGALQNDVKRADEAKVKADAAMKAMDDRAKEMQKAETPDAAEPK